jgi:hypothetical protein
MDSVWVGTIGVLGGVVVGAASQAWLARASFKREKAWAESDEQRARLERVWAAVDQVEEGYNYTYREMMTMLAAKKLSVPTFPEGKIPWTHLRLLVHLYLPRLIPQLDALYDAGNKFGIAAGVGVGMAIEGGADEAATKKLVAASKKTFGEAVKTMKDAILAESEELNKQRQRVTS